MIRCTPIYIILSAALLAGAIAISHTTTLPPLQPSAPAYVVVLHGLGRTSRSMNNMTAFLTSLGYDVLNINYPSRDESIGDCTRDYVVPAIDAHCTNLAMPVNFVTHSMGGILTRYYLAHYTNHHIGRIVMLSPPNRGSEIPDAFKNLSLFRSIMGPAALQLTTGSNSVPNTLGPARYETGIITGDRSLNPIFSFLIPGADDGKVSVQRAGLAGMSDFLILHSSHTFIMNDDEVQRQTAFFLLHGRFDSTNKPVVLSSITPSLHYSSTPVKARTTGLIEISNVSTKPGSTP